MPFFARFLPITHRVTALCIQQVVPFDLAIPAQVFAVANALAGETLYEFSLCAPQDGPVETTSCFSLNGAESLAAISRADTVIVPGYEHLLAPPPEEVLASLRQCAARGARVAAICTGAFALAHAGLLDGRRATTHWNFADELERRFRQVAVDPAALYVDEGQILTSAGLSAGIDLCLHIVRRDHGETLAGAVARAMVAAPQRDGGQAQFIERPLTAPDGALAETQRWALDRLDQQLDVGTLARHAQMSARTFARRFKQETGATPLQWLLSERVHQAQRLLERTDLPVEQVAALTGFGSALSLRQHFRRATTTTPTSYRRAFSSLSRHSASS